MYWVQIQEPGVDEGVGVGVLVGVLVGVGLKPCVGVGVTVGVLVGVGVTVLVGVTGTHAPPPLMRTKSLGNTLPSQAQKS
jgi:hypothetical protein